MSVIGPVQSLYHKSIKIKLASCYLLLYVVYTRQNYLIL